MNFLRRPCDPAPPKASPGLDSWGAEALAKAARRTHNHRPSLLRESRRERPKGLTTVLSNTSHRSDIMRLIACGCQLSFDSNIRKVAAETGCEC